MYIRRKLFFVILALTIFTTSALAQTEQSAPVAATASIEGLSLASPSPARRMRLEIFSPGGELIFDSGMHKGGELQWKLQDQQGQSLADGAYRARVTSEGEGGKLQRQEGTVKVEYGQVSAPQDFTLSAAQVTDGNIVFTTPGTPKYFRDIQLSDNKGGLRFFGASTLSGSPAGAAIQFFGNGDADYTGSAFIDSGAHDSAALIFRTAKTGGAITERLRITSTGNIGIGTAAPTEKLMVAGNIKLASGSLIFPDGTSMSTAVTGGGTPTGSNIVSAINEPTTSGVISDARLSPNVARLNGSNVWSGANVFNFGLSANNALITNVGNPVNAGDATNKAYTDANFVKFVPGAEQLSVGDANGTAPMINLRGGSTCCSGPGGHTPAWFKVFQNGSFVATGNLGIGVSPMQGKGYRTSWDSYKGAFRSGYADNEWDDATVGFFSWAGGSNSTAEGLYAFAFGDTNFARSTSSIAFGSGNEVKGAAGFSAGAGNRVCDTYGVAFGNKAQSGGPLINGKCDPDTFNIRGLAAIALGYNVTADQDHTTAMGKFATNNGFTGTFIWSDGSAQQSADTFRNTANNEFAARATGGFRFRTNLGGTTGCNLPAGSGVFNCTSSRTTKENFTLTSGEDVLTRLRKIPVSTWNYTAEGSQVRHMGPMAEDFYQEFKLGTGNTSIGVQDLAGVSLAAVKALDQRTVQLQQRTAEVEQLRSEVQTLRAANADMEKRLAALEQSMRQERTATTTARRRR
ncbi:MAG TPA: tail fiber domain-containing protein [Pyrinomonadaceae bacterium]|nr:tail fiber domain-containing protein [Pyrinomonadaceae bacterium]